MRWISLLAALALAACSENAPGIVYTVSLNPASATVTAGRKLQLGAIAKGKVTWAVTEAAGGSVDASGLYTAPAAPGVFHVTATSVDDPKKSSSATLTVIPAPAKPVISVPRLVTTGKPATATVPAQDGVTFSWTAFDGTLATASGASVVATAGEVGELVLTCVATNAAGDASAEGVSVSAVIPAATTPVITAPYAVTSGRSALVASVPATPGATFKWTVGNGAIPGPATGSAISFTAGAKGDLVLSVVASNAAGDPAPAAVATVQVHDPGLELVAGAPGGPGAADDVGADARFRQPWGIAEDPQGNLLVADPSGPTLRKIAPGGAVTTLAGAANQFATTDGPGNLARFSAPYGLAADDQGNAYVADYSNASLRRVAPDGATSTLAGNALGSLDGPALGGAQLGYPFALAASRDGGDIWFSELNSGKVRLLSDDGGTPWITTKVNNATAATGLAVDALGVLVSRNCQVDELDGGFEWQVSGAATCGYLDGVGASARFGAPLALATVPGGGHAIVGDLGNAVIRRLDYDAGSNQWSSSTLAGVPQDGGIVDGTAPSARLRQPGGVVVRDGGSVAFTDPPVVRQLSGGTLTTLAGEPAHSDHVDGPGLGARFQSDYDGWIAGVAVDDDGTAYVTDSIYLRSIAPDGTVRTVAGSGIFQAVDGLAGSAGFAGLEGLALDKKNQILYLADTAASLIRTVTWDPDFGAEVVHTVAGVKDSCQLVDGPALTAGFCTPIGLAVDSTGRVFVSDSSNNAIRLLERTPDGGGYEVSTIAAGYGSNCRPLAPTGVATAGVAPINGSLCSPAGLAIDAQDRLYIADSVGHDIKELENDGGVWVMTTIAGTGACASNDGESLDAGFCSPWGVTVDRDGKVWVADKDNATIRRLSPTPAGAWKVETIAGVPGAFGVKPGGLFASPLKPGTGRVNQPGGLAATPTGDILLIDTNENSVLLVRPQ